MNDAHMYRNFWGGLEYAVLLKSATSLTTLDLTARHVPRSVYLLGYLIEVLDSVKSMKCLKKFSIIILKYRRRGDQRLHESTYSDLRDKMQDFAVEVEKEWQVKVSFNDMEDFPVWTWKAPHGCTLNSSLSTSGK